MSSKPKELHLQLLQLQSERLSAATPLKLQRLQPSQGGNSVQEEPKTTPSNKAVSGKKFSSNNIKPGQSFLVVLCSDLGQQPPITTQFVAEHLFTLQAFLQMFNMAAPGYVADIQVIY
jgi:hypothetical protein